MSGLIYDSAPVRFWQRLNKCFSILKTLAGNIATGAEIPIWVTDFGETTHCQYSATGLLKYIL